MAGGQLDREPARPRLHTQTAVGVETGGQRAGERQRDESRRQRPAQDDLAALSRNLHVHAGRQDGGNVVGEPAADGEIEPVLHLLSRRRLLQPQAPLLVTPGERHGAPVDHQGDETGLRRDLQDGGEGAPFEHAADAVPAGGKPDARRALLGVDDRGTPVHAHLQRPDLRVAGQRHAGVMLQDPLLRETPAALVQIEREARRPGAAAIAGVALEERTALLLVPVKDPVDPGAQRLRRLLTGQRSRRRCRAGGGEDDQDGGQDSLHESPGRLRGDGATARRLSPPARGRQGTDRLHGSG